MARSDKELRLRPKTKAVLNKIIENPTISQTDAYIAVHGTKDRKKAGDNASRLINQPSSKIYLDMHLKLAKETALEVLENARKYKDSPAFQKLAADQAERILDRELGKPIQKQITQTTNMNVNVEANKETADAFLEFMKRRTQQ